MEIENGPKMRESDTIEAGKEILPPFDTVVGKVGSMICYDVRLLVPYSSIYYLSDMLQQLRFPEIALALKRQKADVLTYPSAFTPTTGVVHWHALVRARAIENQTYVIAAAQVGPHNEKRSSYGHSVIISPWGEILAELEGDEEMKKKGDSWEPEIAIADIDFETLTKIRREMPLLRRT